MGKNIMKIFISGKITGDSNYKEKFNKIASKLESQGHIVFNPSILPFGLTNEEYIKIGFSMLECCDSIFMLKDWKDSRGATLEYQYAKYCDKNIYFEEMGENNE